ncbi:hypothetical protein ACGFRB_24510 [Streptomyces sp. NPDC048718]|uniref:hypothetical protein n=1 Tax=Streptomyces sp. NPDC048718 TaxID=3365587 RepID=UPI00370FFD43
MPYRRPPAVQARFDAQRAAIVEAGLGLLTEHGYACRTTAAGAERQVFRRAFRVVLAERIAAGVRSGELPPQDAGLTASALVGASAEALTGPLIREAGPGTVPALLTFALRALGVPDAVHP